MAGGRPTKYQGQVTIDKVDEYLLTCGVEEKEFHKTRSDNSNSYDRILKVNLPKLEGFSEWLGVYHGTLLEWEKEYPKFSIALDKIRKAQHNMLLNESIAGNFNSTIAKLILSSNHGYREKSDVTTDGKAININFDNSFNE